MEARRDRQGNLAVYRLPKNDGGGTFEVAGINDRFHPKAANHLADLIKRGMFKEAEGYAVEYICQYTDAIGNLYTSPGVSYLMRDIAFNRGPGGANAIVRMVLGRPYSRQSIRYLFSRLTPQEVAQINNMTPETVIPKITEARKKYEYAHAGYRPNLDRGLRNRWANAQQAALAFK